VGRVTDPRFQSDAVRDLDGSSGFGEVLEDAIEPRERDPMPATLQFFQELSPSDRGGGSA